MKNSSKSIEIILLGEYCVGKYKSGNNIHYHIHNLKNYISDYSLIQYFNYTIIIFFKNNPFII